MQALANPLMRLQAYSRMGETPQQASLWLFDSISTAETVFPHHKNADGLGARSMSRK